MYPNQLRSVLLNENGTNNPGPAFVGEEYVDSTFMAKTITDELLAVYRLFFSNADRAMKNYRLHELMSVIHSSELVTYATNLDTRITYWPATNNSIFTSIFNSPDINQLAGTAALYLYGVNGPVPGTERIYNSYTVTVTDGSHVQVVWETDPNGLSSLISSYSISSGVSNVIALQGGPLSFNFQSGIGASWRVVWIAKPQRSLADVGVQLQNDFTSDLQLVLFGANPIEPYLTFKNIWLNHPSRLYKIVGVALALAYRINDLTV
jgi:hypothetical protein